MAVRVSRVVKGHGLREVIVQIRFTGFEAAGPDINGQLALEARGVVAARRPAAGHVPTIRNTAYSWREQ